MKKLLFIGLFWGVIFNSSAQENYKYLEKLIRTNPDSGINLIDGLQPNIKNSDSSIRYELLKAKALLYSNQNEIAERLVDSIISVTENDTLKMNGNYFKGIFFFYAGRFDEGLAFYKSVLKEAERLKDTAMIGKVSANLSANFIRQNQYDSALTYLEYSLAIDLKNLDSNYIASDYNFFGICYNKLKLYGKAKSELFKALRYNSDPATKANTYYNIANSCLKLMELDSAIFYSKKSETIFLQYNNEYGLLRLYSLFGTAWQGKEQHAIAIDYFNKTIKLAEKRDDQRALSMAYNNLSASFFAKNEPEKAINYAKQALHINQQNNNVEFAINAAENLALAYALMKEVDSARAYLTVSDTMREKFLQNSYYDKLSDVEGRLKTAEKEKALAEEQIKSESLAKETAEAKLVAENRAKWIILLISLVVGIALLFGIMRQRNKRRAQAEKDAAIIEERDRGTQAVFDAQEEERKRISKDLHDGVGQQLSGLKMAFQKLDGELSKELPEKQFEMQKLSKILSESADEVRSISHQMMPKALTELGLVEALDDMLSKSLGLNKIEYQFEHFGIAERLNERIEISLYRVAQELVNNIIKHAKADNIAVQLFKNAGKVILVVEDNGIGVKPNDSDGHGLLNMKSRINAVNGDMNLEPSPGSGTLATIRIPIS